MHVQLYIFVIVAVLLLVSMGDAQKYSSRKRRSKEIEDRISKLDEATKKRIHAMKASGMPKEAIAEKISYVAGGKNIAKRIVDALHDEPEGKVDHKKKKPTAPTTPSAPKPKTAPKAAPKAEAPKTATKAPPKAAAPKTATKTTGTKNSPRGEL